MSIHRAEGRHKLDPELLGLSGCGVRMPGVEETPRREGVHRRGHSGAGSSICRCGGERKARGREGYLAIPEMRKWDASKRQCLLT